MTALLIIGVGVGGYALYRWWEREGAPSHPAARGYFTGYDSYVGRGGPMRGFGGMHGHHSDSMHQQQMQQGGGEGGDGGTSGMDEMGMPQSGGYAHRPQFGQQHSFGHPGFSGRRR